MGLGNKRSGHHASPGHPAASSPPGLSLLLFLASLVPSSSPPSLIGRNWLFQNRNFHSEPKQACYLDLSREKCCELPGGGGAPEEQNTHIHPRRLLTKSLKLLGQTEATSFPHLQLKQRQPVTDEERTALGKGGQNLNLALSEKIGTLLPPYSPSQHQKTVFGTTTFL